MSDSKLMPWHLKIGIPAFLAGVAIVAPVGIKELAVAVLKRYLNLDIQLERSSQMGIFLIVVGLVIIFVGEWMGRNLNKTTYAFRHHSFPGFLAPLVSEGPLTEVDCDQSIYLPPDRPIDLAGAIRYQRQKMEEMFALRRNAPSAPLIYYGIVHVPFQFLAGRMMQNHSAVINAELQRNPGTWKVLDERGPVLAFSKQHLLRPANPVAVAIAIAISYEIDPADIAQILEEPYELIRIGVSTPRIDAITSKSQLVNLARTFRATLDEIKSRLPGDITVHVFYSGPVSAGFTLGKQISPTVHHKVVVYNYSQAETPRYPWGIDVSSNGDNSKMIVIPTPRGA